jgi:hypothetical protein
MGGLRRIAVARAARSFPLILDLLADGSVHLTAVKLLAPHLRPENHREVLESARGKTKLEIQEIVARLAPKPDAPTSIRRVPPPQPQSMAASADLPALAIMPAATALPETAPPAVPPAARANVAPLSPRCSSSWPGGSSRARPDREGRAGPSGEIHPLRSSAASGCGTAVAAEVPTSQRLRRKTLVREAETIRPTRSRPSRLEYHALESVTPSCGVKPVRQYGRAARNSEPRP